MTWFQEFIVGWLLLGAFLAGQWCVRDVRGFEARLKVALYGPELPQAKVVRR